jgi:hypothetical protein
VKLVGKFVTEIGSRTQRAILGLVGKKFVAWYAATYLLVQNYINGSEWVMLTVAVFALQIAQNRFGGGYAMDSGSRWNFGSTYSQMGAANPGRHTNRNGRNADVQDPDAQGEGDGD